MDARRRRQAENEILFRSINERIEGIGEELFADPSEEVKVYDFVCECANSACTEQIPLSKAEYEAVRADGTHFLVAPDPAHVDMTIESVVDMSSRYWVVEKKDESGEVAESADPRS